MVHLNDLLKLPLPLVLASQSPRRRALLEHVGFSFTSVVPDVDEDAVLTTLPPATYVQELAVRKARRGAMLCTTPSIVIGSDTTVVLDGAILNKPVDADHARQMLSTLSGRTHTVHTGLALVQQERGRVFTTSTSTDVTFRILDADEIAAYVAGGSPLDKAGAYGIQDDFGAVFVRHIHGCYYTIVGLPLETLYTSLRSFAEECR